MTITGTGRRSREQILAEAREQVGAEALPSKTSLSKALNTHFTIASEIHDLLSQERRQERAERARERRQAMSRVARRKGFGRAYAVRPRPFTNPAQPLPETPPAEATSEVLPAPVAQVVVQAPEPVVTAPCAALRKQVATWPIFLLALPAFVAIWSGWVDLGRLTGFGLVHPFPGIPVLEKFQLNTAITLPIGLETYAAYALYVWLSGQVPAVATQFAKYSAIGSLCLGALGQIAYHLMVAAGVVHAPWWITTIVACLPVAVLGMGAALRHLVNAEEGAK